jgi:hypothetical protein
MHRYRAGESLRVNINALQFSEVSGPSEFVLFVAMQEIEFNRFLFDCAPNRQRKCHHAHARISKAGIESGLIEVKLSISQESVNRGGGLSIHAKHKEAKPSPIQRDPAEFFVK